MGSKEFEHLIQALLKVVIGSGTTTFGDGPDGGREATYSGLAPYPSPAEQWDGEWIFQAKFHDTRQIGPETARKQIVADLRSELEKITVKYKRRCNNYILATNVRLSATHASGTHDKISKEIIPDFCQKIPNIHVWGYDDVARLLDGNPAIRQTYLHLVSPGDLIAELLERRLQKRSALAESVLLYVTSTFNNEQYAQLDQAGEIAERPMPLRRVYVDLDVRCRSDKDVRLLPSRDAKYRRTHYSLGQ
jgi:hypothetical protein